MGQESTEKVQTCMQSEHSQYFCRRTWNQSFRGQQTSLGHRFIAAQQILRRRQFLPARCRQPQRDATVSQTSANIQTPPSLFKFSRLTAGSIHRDWFWFHSEPYKGIT